jgi:hypothetical protein
MRSLELNTTPACEVHKPVVDAPALAIPAFQSGQDAGGSMDPGRVYLRHLILTGEAAEVDDLEAGAHVCIFGLWSPENISIDGGL